jgi:hypothetical protein
MAVAMSTALFFGLYSFRASSARGRSKGFGVRQDFALSNR